MAPLSLSQADRKFFSNPKPSFGQDGVFLRGDGKVTGMVPPGRTTYHCELLVKTAAGNAAPRADRSAFPYDSSSSFCEAGSG
jgi:hypothetical protein